MSNAFVLALVLFAAAGPLAAQNTVPSTAAYSEVPEEVVVKGETEDRMTTARPPLNINIDSFESLRRSLRPDRSLFLFESGDFLSLSRSSPGKLFSTKVVQPWRTGFSDKTVIAFYPLQKSGEVFKDYTEKGGKEAQWTLSITDEGGQLFHKYSGSGIPPETINWTGENDRHEWLSAGRSYAPVYVFSNGGASRTVIGELMKFTAIIYQKGDNLIISLDSVSLFGPGKSAKTVDKSNGEPLLAAVSDLIKRRYYNTPLKVNVYARTRDLAAVQADKVGDYLKTSLMSAEELLSSEGLTDTFARQRTDIVLLNK
ncbi:MAG: hypothetical protein COT18_04920 [Elusimicrobia bacterium CG08_land_8_20_14_0_20_59_10]|nr:MAG: hypothetical protein COT18_04920 [Elusimicrobia bacterium CG08_land_8_20_14_0_20_59_10]